MILISIFKLIFKSHIKMWMKNIQWIFSLYENARIHFTLPAHFHRKWPVPRDTAPPAGRDCSSSSASWRRQPCCGLGTRRLGKLCEKQGSAQSLVSSNIFTKRWTDVRVNSLHWKSGAESVHVDVTVQLELFIKFKCQLGMEASREVPERISQSQLKWKIWKITILFKHYCAT